MHCKRITLFLLGFNRKLDGEGYLHVFQYISGDNTRFYRLRDELRWSQ